MMLKVFKRASSTQIKCSPNPSSFQQTVLLIQAISRIKQKQSLLLASPEGQGKTLSWILATKHLISQQTDLSLKHSYYSSRSIDQLFQQSRKIPNSRKRHGVLVIAPIREQILHAYYHLRTFAPQFKVHRTTSYADISAISQFFSESKITESHLKKQGFISMCNSLNWDLFDYCISTPKTMNDIIKYKISNKETVINPSIIVLEDTDLLLLQDLFRDRLYASDTINLLNTIGNISSRQLILCASHLREIKGTPNVVSYICSRFDGVSSLVSPNFAKINPDIKFNFFQIEENQEQKPLQHLLEIIKKTRSKRVMIYSAYVSRCNDIAQQLQSFTEVTLIHSDQDIETRVSNLMSFITLKNKVIVGNELMIKAVNFTVDHLILYNIPNDYSSLLQKLSKSHSRVSLIVRPGEQELVKDLKVGGRLSNFTRRIRKKTK